LPPGRRCCARLSLFRRRGGAEGVERPDVLNFIVAEDVEISVVGANPEIDRVRLVPLVFHVHDLKFPAANRETRRPLVGAVARIALHLDGTHTSMLRRAKTGRRAVHTRRFSGALRRGKSEMRAIVRKWGVVIVPGAATVQCREVATACLAPDPRPPAPSPEAKSASSVAATALYAAPTITTSATKYIQIINPITAAMLP